MAEKQTQKLTPAQIEFQHQQQFLEAYNKLVAEYGYMIQPVLKLELVKIQKKQPKVKENEADNNNSNS